MTLCNNIFQVFAHCSYSRGYLTMCYSVSVSDFTPEEDRATAIGNMHKNMIKIARVVPEIVVDRQTDRQTHIRTHYNSLLANAAAGEALTLNLFSCTNFSMQYVSRYSDLLSS